MYKKAAPALRIIAFVAQFLGIIASVFSLLFTLRYNIIVALIVAALLVFSAWISSIFIHGFAELLEAAGVDTVKELKHRVPANLQAKMEEVNAQKNLVNRVPSEKELTKMIAEAKELPAAVEY